MIANLLATHIVDEVFAAPNRHSSLEVLVAVYGYAVQIFADFCGYTNIAIGIALLLGFQFPQNFNSPYAAVSLQDFWRRWHMTLSRWLRDYLYIPLGGSRKGSLITYRNLLLTFLLGGLWHGAAWTFVAWGALHGTGLAVERAVGWRPTSPAARWLGRLLTFNFVCFAWIFFRADSFGRVGEILERLFTAWGQPSPLVTTSVVLAIVVGIGVQYVGPGVLRGLLRGFGRLPVARPGGDGRRVPDADQHARPGRGRAVHLLPLLTHAAPGHSSRPRDPRAPVRVRPRSAARRGRAAQAGADPAAGLRAATWRLPRLVRWCARAARCI